MVLNLLDELTWSQRKIANNRVSETAAPPTPGDVVCA